MLPRGRASPKEPAAFPFSYMDPQKSEFSDVITRYNAANVSVNLMAPIGAPQARHWLHSPRFPKMIHSPVAGREGVNRVKKRGKLLVGYDSIAS